MNILINGNNILNKETLFENLKKQINIEEFYGNSLDALYDILSAVNEEINVTIINLESLQSNLGNYANSLIKLFEDLKLKKGLCLEILVSEITK